MTALKNWFSAIGTVMKNPAVQSATKNAFSMARANQAPTDPSAPKMAEKTGDFYTDAMNLMRWGDKNREYTATRKFDPEAGYRKGEKLIKEGYGQARTALSERQKVAKENALADYQRAHATGNVPGGAAEMLKSKYAANVDAQFAGQGNELEAAQTQALSNLRGATTEQAQKQAMFNAQMDFANRELAETERNDIVNAIGLFKNIGLGEREFTKWWGPLLNIYGYDRIKNMREQPETV